MNSRAPVTKLARGAGVPSMVDSSQSYLNGLNNEQMSLGGQLTKENLTIRHTPQLIAEKANAFEQAKTACSTDHLSTAVSNFNFTGVFRNIRFSWGNDTGNTGLIDKILYRQ